jgi:hypothetical protein
MAKGFQLFSVNSDGVGGSDDMYKIIGIVNNHYIVKTHKGLKKVKILGDDKKNINDEIKITKL